MLRMWLLTELPSKGTWKVPAWHTVRRRGGSESVRKDEITQIASALLRSAGGRGRLEEKPCLPGLCALSCVVRWPTQPWQGYTGLILRQLGCNNLCPLATNPRNARTIHSAVGGPYTLTHHSMGAYARVKAETLYRRVSENEPSRILGK